MSCDEIELHDDFELKVARSMSTETLEGVEGAVKEDFLKAISVSGDGQAFDRISEAVYGEAKSDASFEINARQVNAQHARPVEEVLREMIDEVALSASDARMALSDRFE